MKEILDILAGFRTRGIVLSLEGSGRNIKARGNVKDLSASDRQLLKERKEDIVLLLKQAYQTSVNIEPLSNKEHYTLSSSQRRLWLLSQFEEAAAVYNIPLSIVLEGEVNEQAFHKTFYSLTARHESLRTIFTVDADGEPGQVILEPEHSGFTLSCIDLRSSSAESEVTERITRYNAETFHLRTGPLMRAALMRLEEKKWVLHCVLHHIISDGWSVHILVQELLRLYDAYNSESENPLLPLRIQYKDYAAWQQKQLHSEQFSDDKAYWLRQFEGELPVLELPVDRARPRVKTYKGALVERQLPLGLGNALAALSQQQGGTLFMGLLAAVKALLYHYSGQTDIITGTPIAGREHAELEGQIGFFLNTLPLRTRFNPEASFCELLEQVKEVTLGAFAHQNYPFEVLVDTLHLQHDRSRSPLFDVLVILQNTGLHTAEQQQKAGGLNVSLHRGADVQVSKFDLTIAFVEAAEGLQISIEYNTDIYNTATIERMAAHLERLIGAAVARPDISIEQLDYLSEEEKHQLLVKFNDTDADYPKDKTLVQLFEEQAQRTPEATAVLFEDKKLFYKELNEEANQLANYLKANYELQSEDIIGVKLERSEKLIVTLLAVLKSGAAYVPIDPEYPQERIDYMTSDSGCKLVIDEDLLDNFLQNADEYSRKNHTPSHLTPSSLAYTIYTSGSTGQPKGVMIGHRNVVAFLSWCGDEFRNSDFDTVFATTSVCFDLSIFEIFYTLTAGKKLRVLPNGLSIPQYLHTSNKILVNTVPSIIGTLLSEGMDFSNVTVVNMAGEPIPAGYIRQLDCERMEVRNLYGPSEDTTYSTVFRIKGDGSVLIGCPISNTRIYITGSGRQLVPAGAIGEICISGAGLARGYLNRVTLTAEKFVIQSFGGKEERIYRTGDLGRWLPDGNIEFLGRKDNQVKVRGYRIELGEIENALQSIEGIEAAVVLAKPTVTGEKKLVAYLVSNQGTEVQQLRSSLGKCLPVYMIPTHFVQLDKLPLTPNGKVDRKRLPEPEGLALSSSVEYIAPRNQIEEKLAAIWQDILGREKVGVKDDFFHLGGHSLKATRLGSRIHREFEVKVELKELFNRMTIEEQAELIEQSQKSSFAFIKPVAEQIDYAVSSPQRRLWILSQFEQANTAYNMPGAYLFEGALDLDAFSWSLQTLIRRHESLRTVFRQDSEDRPRQVIRPAQDIGFDLLLHDLRHEEEREQKVKELVQQDFVRPFNLVNGPLLRASLYQTKDYEWVFSYVLHHIIGDGWSMQILMKELLLLYNARVQGAENPLQPLRIQYKDYAIWQQEQLSGASLLRHKNYWLKQLEGELPVLELASDRPRPAEKSYRGAIISRRFGPGLNSTLKALAKRQDATLYIGLLAAVNVLLYRYTGQEDIIVGGPIAGRQHADLEGQIGFYVNLLALRTRLQGSDSFEQLLSRVKKETLQAYEHQVYPFDELVEEVHQSSDTSRHPLFDVVVVLQNTEIDNDLSSAGLQHVKLRPYDEGKRVVSLFDLRFDFREAGGELFFGLEYNSGIFNSERIERLADNFHQLLLSILEQPSQSIAQLDYISSLEKSLISVAGTPASYPANTTIVDLFEEQVERTPHHTAIAFEDQSISYAELNQRANCIAHFLLHQTGLKKGEGVGILLSRSPECVIAILGILKAGGVYIPMQTDTPEDRLRFVINDTGMRAVISEKAFIELLHRLQWSCPCLDAYLCVDSTDVYAEKEREENTMMSQELWDHVGEKAVDQITGGGWSSSFTGEPIPAEEMEEYAMNAYRKLSGLLHSGMRVLEIGCSSGLTLSKIAPQVELYYGTDMSPVILENTWQMVEKAGLTNVKLKCLVAHEISSLEQGFDLVIINSVIQHFHGHNYLRKVIADVVELLNERGMIFVGDVMDMELKDQLIQDLEDFKAQNRDKGYTTKTDFSADLFVAKGFFEDLIIDQPGITRVEIGGKIRTIENELTLYRYDAILQVDKSTAKNSNRKRNKHQYSSTILDVQPSHNLRLPILSSDLAYIIYTSGTTGRPKGSLIEHRNVVRLFMTDKPLFDFSAQDVWTLFHSYSFDFSVWEMYGALLFGGKLVIVPSSTAKDPSLFRQLLLQHKVTVLNQTPSAFYNLVREELESEAPALNIRYVIFGGEALSPGKLAGWKKRYPQTELINMYGITETTVHVTYKKLSDEDISSNSSNIGKPIPTLSCYVLDQYQQKLPLGVWGELYVGGEGVCRGYLNRDELTAQRFLSSPFRTGERLYRTGDKARLMENGELEYGGRIDEQVKIRGYRIELGEIQHMLEQHSDIESAVVMARTGRDGERELVAYVVSSQTLISADLSAYLGKTLPAFMLPSHYVQLESLPLTVNGKVNRKALPDPEGLNMATGVDYIAPRNETEQKLVLIWQEVLGREHISVKDNFFDLGGHSLKATRLTNHIRKVFEVKVELKNIFLYPVLEDQAMAIDQACVLSFAAIPLAPLQDSYPLSSSQLRLWVVSQFEEASIAYNMPGATLFEGVLNLDSFSWSLQTLLERHESLRTVFRQDGEGQPYQVILPVSELGFSLFFQNLRQQQERKLKVKELVSQEFIRPFDLSTGPLLRASLYQIEEDKWVFSYVLHHIIGDGWSMEILIKELLLLYNAQVQGIEHFLKPLRIQYKDYAVWQQEQLRQDELNIHKAYWLRQFEGELPVLELPLDYPRLTIKNYRGGVVTRDISALATEAVRTYSQQQEATLFMGIVAAIDVLLYRYTGQQDIIIGSPTAGRIHADLEDQIGCYVNMLALRSRFTGEQSYSDLLAQVRQMTLQAYAHQLYPFDELVDALGLQRDASRNPLFDVTVALQNIAPVDAERSPAFGEMRARPYTINDRVTSKFDLNFNFTEQGAGLHLVLEYNSDLFDHSTAERLAAHLEQLLESVTKAPDLPVGQIDFMITEEKKRLLYFFNDTAILYPADKTIVQLFEEQVERTPGKLSLVFEDRTFTYRQLNEVSNQVAHYLRTYYTITPDDLIAIQLERSEWMLIAILGVLKSGAAYVPISDDYPAVRIRHMLEDSGSKLVIDAALLERFCEEQERFSTDNLTPSGLTPSHLAYVMYTSGSTGKPKGVLVEHRSVVRLVLSANFISLAGDEILLTAGAFSFDATTFEYWSMLLHGGTLVMTTRETLLDSSLLLQEIRRSKVEIMFFTTGWLNQLVDEKIEIFGELKTILTGGEKISIWHIQKLRDGYPQLNIIHCYGPTENTTFSLTHNIETVNNSIPLGKPISNSTAYILDAQQKLLPIGAVGEICVGGDGLARGYLNNPELTSDKFIKVDLPLVGEMRLYRSGDLGRWLEDGSIEFLGRSDDQVKIRGYRIEIAEIQQALESYPGMDAAVVQVCTADDDEKLLAAYIVGRELLNTQELRGYLNKRLPSYMIPSYYVQLEALPLNANGKVDRDALPDPQGMELNTGVEYIAPRSRTEEKLVQIWQRILGRDNISVKDNFFELGGHSLKLTRLASQVHKVFDVKIELRHLFQLVVLEDQAQLIEQSARSSFITIEPVEQQDDYALSSSQRRVWVMSQFEEANVAYNMPGAWIFEGWLDRKALEAAFASLIERHESLRTTFRENEQGEVRQFIHPAGALGFSLDYLDLRKGQQSEQSIKDLVEEDFIRPFDLSVGPLLRASFYQVEDSKWVFSYVMHHIISDGWSMGIIIRELFQFYDSHTKGEASSLTPLRIQYKDYAAWQQQQLSCESLQAHKDYWLRQFEGELPVLELTSDKSRPPVKTYNGRSIHLALSAELSREFKTQTQQQGGTLFMGLLAVVNVLLYRYTGHQDIIIGSPIAGRQHADLEEQIGFYLNTLALRCRFSGEQSFSELLEQVKQLTLDAYEHQVYPFDELVDLLNLRRDLSRSALFDVMVILQNNERSGVDALQNFEGLRISSYGKGETTESKFDLSFNFSEEGNELQLVLVYNRDIYAPSTAERMIRHLEHLVSAIVKEPLKPIQQLDYLQQEEKQQLLSEFNDTAADYPRDKTLVNLFEEQAERMPDVTAVVFEDKELTYRELNEQANQLAHYIRSNYNLQPDDLVGVQLERSEKMIVTLLGVLKSGAAYVPIDPENPQERIDYIVQDSNCKLVIDEELLSNFTQKADEYSKESLTHVNLTPSNLAYVIYTSGSTGRPKGCMLEYKGVVNRLAWMHEHYGYTSNDIILQKTTFTFDVSVWELFLPLCWGMKMVLCHKDDIASPERIATLIEEQKVTCLHFVPSMFNAFLASLFEEENIAERLKSLRLVITSGEALMPATIQSWHGKMAAPVHNLYGPTEASVDVTYYATSSTDKIIPIGRPIWNTQMYILHNHQTLVPVGITGEICITGDGLARGYLNKPELTAEKFVANSFKPGARMYRTGDLGRWLPDGNIEYLGRMDHQVKIRGYRIELGEIEDALQSAEGIEAAVVMAKTSATGEKELVAYLVSSHPIEMQKLRTELGRILPAYMIPTHFVQLDKLPLTSSGKVDRKALPDPEGLGLGSGVEYIAPRTGTEEKLAAIWMEILGKEKAGVKDNFFELGGHSLKATRLVSQVHKKFEVRLELRDLFLQPVLEQQAMLIEQSSRISYITIPAVEPQDSYPLSSSQRRLWVLSQFSEASLAYHIPSVIVIEGSLDLSALELALSALLERHESLRTVFREDEKGEVKQFILSPEQTGFSVRFEDLRGSEEKVQQLLQQALGTVFNLSEGPLLRVTILQLEDSRWVFALVMHHIISDGWSMNIFIKEALQFYYAYTTGQPNPLTPLRIHYKDYATWQQEQLSEENLQAHKNYWLKQFEGDIPVLELPSDNPRPAVKTYNGGQVQLQLDAELTRGLKALTQQQGGTLFMGILAAVNTLLYRYTGQPDIILGTPIAGRQHADLEEQIGFYLNTLALRSRFSGEQSFSELLEQVKQITLDAYEHQVYPFDELVDLLDLRRDLSRRALFDVMVVLQNNERSGGDALQNFEGLRISSYGEGGATESKFDLSFSFSETNGELQLLLTYNSDIYSPSTAEQLARHLRQLISAIVREPLKPIRQLNYLAEEEQRQLLSEFGGAAFDYPKDKTIVHLFEEQANQTPNATAVVFEENALTYEQLNGQANQLADCLITNHSIAPDDLVAVKLERSEWMIVALLGILKSGGAYVAIDLEYPEDRVSYMLEDSRCKLVIDAEFLEAFGKEQDQYRKDNLITSSLPSHLAYVLYTSGSTGKPKGVMIEHRSLVDYCFGLFQETNIRECRSFGLVSTLAADLGNTVLFPSLISGGALHIFSADDVTNPERMLAASVDCIKIVPSHWKMLQSETQVLAPNRMLVFGGEQLTVDVLQLLKQNGAACKVYNHYGPSETTIGKLLCPLDLDKEHTRIPLGSPFCNSSVYILDSRYNLQPIGVVGEICISGDGLARGYLNKPELTAEKFITIELSTGSTRIYRTGDLGRWLHDGTIEFLGRSDDQVKIRGYRIELGEIEDALLGVESINAAVVMARTAGNSEKELVAYIVAEQELTATFIRAELSGSLPAFMIPGHFVLLEQLPLTANGKVDRKRLPDPEGLGLGTGVEYIAPRNATEEKLAAIWQEILGKESIGVKDNFFNLGGHSLRATRLVSQVYKQFEVKLGLKDIFVRPTLEQQATLIKQSTKISFITIPAVEQQDFYPMSSSQRRLWVLSQFGEASLAYHIPAVLVIEGSLDLAALRLAFSALLGRHESLRTVFREDAEGDVKQFILSPEQTGFAVRFEDLREQEQKVQEHLQEILGTAFSLSEGPLLRVAVFQVEENKWVFAFVLHHIISDGWSMNIFIKESLQLYYSYTNGGGNSLTPLRIHYKDYAVWQQEQLSGENLEAHKNYWLKQFEGELPILELPSDMPRPAVKTYNGGQVQLRLNTELSKGLKALSQQQGGTLFMGILAAVNTLLYRYTGQEDLILGTPIAGRQHADLEEQIGFYLNTLALRSRFSGEQSFSELLEQAKQVTLDAYEHQLYPFDELVDLLDLRRDLSRSALFDVMVILQNNERRGSDALQNLEGLRISSYGEGGTESKFDLTFAFLEEGDELQLSVVYNSDIYSLSTAERLALHLEQLVSAIVREPLKPIQQLDYLSEEEKQQLHQFNDTAADYPGDKKLISLFEEQAERTPDATALIFEEIALTYKQLNEQANQLAYFLRTNHNIRPDDLAGVKLERSEWMIIALLGVLKSGAAYVPIDPEYPQERIDYIIQDSACKLVIDEELLESFSSKQEHYSQENLSSNLTPSHLAYVIYTSGSTGRPKGCMLEHRGVVNRLAWMHDHYGYTSDDIILQKTTFTFDVSVWELFLPLCWGMKMVLCHKDDIASPERIATLIEKQKVTCLHFVPSMFNAFIASLFEDENIAERLKSLRLVITSGEALMPATVQGWYRKMAAPIHNLYGPTEASVDVTYYATSATDTVVPIGRPIWNTQMYILGDRQALVPVGVTGEICIAGDGLARGYLNKPELTEEKFVPNPFKPGERMYRTGDLGRWLPDGNIEYLGRMDNQVKIRGNRIELGEVEKVLSTFPAIAQAIVTVRKVKDEKVLVAYYTSAEPIDKIAVRQYLQQKLPGYMVPGYFVLLTEVPLTASGKVDRKALPAIKEEDVIHREYVAPRDATERKLVSIWEEVLGRLGIGIKDNFFEMGGHSLKAMQVISRLYKELNVKVELKILFNYPTIEELSRQVEQSEASSYTSIPVVAEAAYYDVSYAQKRLWVLSQFEGGVQAYNMPMILELKGKLEISCFARAFETLVARHEILRTVFIAVEGSPKQKVLAPEEYGFELQYRNLRNKKDQKSVAKQWLQEESQKRFDLEEGPLLRAMLIQLEEERHLFCFTMHHIISDGWSMEVMVREVASLYNSYREGKESDLPALKLQYKDYTAWQQQELSGEKLEAHRNYWLQQLKGELPVLELPTDYPRPAVKTYNGSTLNFAIDNELTSRLAEISINKGGSLFMTLVSTIAVLLHKYSGQDDIILGTPIAGRHHKELEDQLGFYVNLLTLRTRIDKQVSFEALVEQVKQNTLEAYEHQHYPFDKLVEELPLERDTSRSPLFDVMVVLQNTQAVTGMEELQIKSYPVESRISKYDVSISFKQTAEGLAGVVEYNTDLFTRERIEKLIVHYKHLVKQLTEDVTIELSRVSLMSKEEATALAAFSSTPASYPTDKTIQELFEQQAATTPQAPAVVYYGRSLSYQQLNEQSNQLAHYLRARYDIQPDDLIAVMTERSQTMVIALLAILKSGAAYVPIDPSYPEERIRYMLQDSGAKTLLRESQATTPMEGLLLQDAIQQSSTYSKANPVHINKSNDLAYVIYTSGSTGIPKGVMIEHTSLVNLCFWHNNAFSVNEQSRASLYAAIGFDASAWELWPYLIRGASVYPVPEELRLEVYSLAEFIAGSSLTHSFLPTPVCESLFQEKSIVLPQELWLLTGGDKLSKVKPRVRLVNNYGPTEGTVVATSVLLEQEVISKGVIPIGRPISNTKVSILDDSMNQVPVGVVGEICISGPCLARGYLNKEEATSQKFVLNPVGTGRPFIAGERMYKTGDLGKWQPDGNIVFLGRKDDQVKIRGYRIELGEIEQILGSQAGIEQAVVLVKEKETGEKYLVAYYTSKQHREAQQLKAYLGKSLPHYMVPSYFVQLESFPLTPNGKIDRKALPAPETKKSHAIYVAPRTEVEEQLVVIWKKVLGMEKVGITDDFFESGGHSLNITRMLYEINRVFDIKLQIKAVFASRTVQELAQVIEDEIIFKNGVAVNTTEQIINEKNSELWEI